MIGPLLVAVAGLVVGGLLGGAGGAAGGLLGAAGIIGAVAVGAAVWAQRIGRLVDADTAWRMAPRPPGFGPMCDAIYRRFLPKP